MSEFKQVIKRAFSLHDDAASNDEIRNRIISGGQVTGTNMCVLICAILIASVGLNTGSAAVIIGAMLVSPLMGSILALAYGTVSVDIPQVIRNLYGFLFQIITSLLVSTIYFLLSPVNAPTSELLARTQPTFYDVIIAISGGFAGIIGVAIATALMPPLCTCGFLLHMGNGKCLQEQAICFL